jgi:UDP-N-acetylglucosamine acyltransferase
MTGVGTVLLQDVPPYVMASGDPARPFGINAEGLKRRGFSADAVQALKRAYRSLYRSGLSLEQARAALAEQAEASPEVRLLADFLAEPSRGLLR